MQDSPPLPPAPARSRPHRLIVNLDAETFEGIKALAAVSGMSRSATAAMALEALVPMVRPIVAAMAVARSAPGAALEKLSQHAAMVAEQSDAMLKEIRAAALEEALKRGEGGETLPPV